MGDPRFIITGLMTLMTVSAFIEKPIMGLGLAGLTIILDRLVVGIENSRSAST